MYSKNNKTIPKIIHQIWIGPHKLPSRFIDTWKNDYMKENTDWEYKLWRERDIEQLNMINKDIYDMEKNYAGKSDIARLEILNKYGGIYIDADSVWVNNKSLNKLIDESIEEGLFASIEPTKNYLANGVIGSTANNENLEFLINEIKNMKGKYSELRKKFMPFQLTGPYLLERVRKTGRKIKVLPTNYFYPEWWHGVRDFDRHKKIDLPKEAFMYQYGISTNNLFNLYGGNTNDKIAVIVEPRNDPVLIDVVLNFINILGNEWKIKIFYGNKNEDMIMSSVLNKLINDGRILLKKLNVDNLNSWTYSDMLKSKQFWLDCEGENILIFQIDSSLCSRSMFSIDNFSDFDYIGSAWIYTNDDIRHGGNGGLSFRKKSAMIECIDKFPPTKSIPGSNLLEAFPEDVYFITCLKKLNKKISTKEESLKFGTQNFFKYESFGTHQFYNFLNKSDKDKFMEYCPESKIIYKIKYGSTRNFKIIDCFTFYNELKMLKFRLEELYDHVDYFVIVESDVTFSGNKKELFFKDNRNQFKKYLPKIIHVVINDMPEYDNNWKREEHQRNAIKQGIKRINLNQNDLILIGDVDEIPNMESVNKIAYKLGDEILTLEMDMYYYNLECKNLNPWKGIVITKFKNLLIYNPEELRKNRFKYDRVANGGWHFSYFFGSNNIKNKIKNFSHQEYNTNEFTNNNNINRKMENCEDLFNRKDQKWTKASLDKNSLPYNYELLI